MAEVVWTEPALTDLDAIADYIALDDPAAAARLVQRVYRHVGQLAAYPTSGTRLPELRRSRFRQIVEPPCRVIYRIDRQTAYLVHVVRSERPLRPPALRRRTP